MMKEYNKFEDDLGQFKVEAQELINKVSRLFSRQYKESLTAERRSLWTLRIAFIGVLLTAIFFIISTYCTGESVNNERHHNPHNLAPNNPYNIGI